MLSEVAVARECREHVIVAEILASRFEFFRSLAGLLAKHGQRVAEDMRVGIRQSRPFECLSENCTDTRLIVPVTRNDESVEAFSPDIRKSKS